METTGIIGVIGIFLGVESFKISPAATEAGPRGVASQLWPALHVLQITARRPRDPKLPTLQRNTRQQPQCNEHLAKRSARCGHSGQHHAETRGLGLTTSEQYLISGYYGTHYRVRLYPPFGV